MSAYAIWIDHEEAKIFKFHENRSEVIHVKEPSHTALNKGNQKHVDAEKFFHDVATKIGDAEEIFLCGPGLGKDHFKTHLEKHHHEKLAKKIVGMEAMDHPTDNQIRAGARKFFRHFDLYAGI